LARVFRYGSMRVVVTMERSVLDTCVIVTRLVVGRIPLILIFILARVYSIETLLLVSETLHALRVF
jgi:hypothetical protein